MTLIDSPKVKRQNHCQTVKDTSENVEQKNLTDKPYAEAPTHTLTHTPPAEPMSHFKEMFSLQMNHWFGRKVGILCFHSLPSCVN